MTILNKNIIANYVGKVWGFISVFLFVPFYIKILGIESYAIINFYTVILTVLYFADSGLSATLNREIARTIDKQYLGNMLFTIERIYIFICLFVILGVFSFSKIIATEWLTAQTISDTDVQLCISLMGVSVAFQLFTSLQNSGLMGLEQQVLSNTIQIISNILRSAAVLVPLYFYPSVVTFFVWQMIINIIFFFITRFNLWKLIKADLKYSFDLSIFKSVGKFAAGMMIMAIISSLNTQIDKLVISKILSLKDFGYYAMASTISQLPLLFITPIAAAILPKMVKYQSLNRRVELVKLFHSNSYVLAALSTTFALILFLFAKDYIFIWTGNQVIVKAIENITKILLIGGVFLSLQFMPYYLAIANGHTKTNVRFGLFVILLIVPLLIIFVNTYGLIGATFTWLALNVFAFIYLGHQLINLFLKNEFKVWLIYDTFVPIVIACILGIFGYVVFRNLPKGYYVLLYSSIVFVLAVVANIYSYYFIFLKQKPPILSFLRKILYERNFK